MTLQFREVFKTHNYWTMYHFGYILNAWGEMNKTPEMPVRFYRTEAGGTPVLDWLRGLDKADRRAIGLDLMRVQFGWGAGCDLSTRCSPS